MSTKTCQSFPCNHIATVEITLHYPGGEVVSNRYCQVHGEFTMRRKQLRPSLVPLGHGPSPTSVNDGGDQADDDAIGAEGSL